MKMQSLPERVVLCHAAKAKECLDSIWPFFTATREPVKRCRPELLLRPSFFTKLGIRGYGHMATSIIDGTLVDSVAGRSRPNKFTVFKSLTFQRNDGSTEVLKRQVVQSQIADMLKPGASGRFYTFTAMDMKGVHGIRLKDGTSVYSYHSANLMLFPLLGAINIAWIALLIVTRDSVPMLGVLMLGLAIVGYFVTRRSIVETKCQFDEDNGAATEARKDVARVTTTAAIDAS